MNCFDEAISDWASVVMAWCMLSIGRQDGREAHFLRTDRHDEHWKTNLLYRGYGHVISEEHFMINLSLILNLVLIWPCSSYMWQINKANINIDSMRASGFYIVLMLPRYSIL